MAKKACKRCKHIVKKEVEVCPACRNNSFTNTWKGRIIIIDPVRSLIAKKIDAKVAGEYAIKIR